MDGEIETNKCKQCGEHYTLRQECEPTDYCDLCAQTMLAEAIARAERAEKAAEETRELAIMQLAGISTATIQNTETTIKDRINRDNPYWTQAYEDVCVAVDREMRERTRAERAEAACASLHYANSNTWPWVLGFALEMERKLSKNRHKGYRDGWVGESSDWLLSRLKEELAELQRAALNGTDEDVRGEAADVANFAMMIADVSGCLEPFKFLHYGEGYVRREELEIAKSRLAKLDAYPEENENVQGFILDVLEQLEKRGIDTTNWDGDESSATIMASCVAGKIRETQAELDAAKADNARLREALRTLIADLKNEEIRKHFPFTANYVSKKAEQALAGKEDGK